MLKSRKVRNKKKSNPDFFYICKKYKYSDFKSKHLKEADEIYDLHTISNGDLKLLDESYERKDHRLKDVFTIDGEDAKDLDDAVAISKTLNSYILFVYVADVAYYIKENSILDIEAMQRGNSVYLLDNVIPMFPKPISNDLCSLNEDKDRLAICVEMEFSFSGKLLGYQIYHALIKVKKRLTYNYVQKILDEKIQLTSEEENLKSVFDMELLAKNLYKKRLQNGSIDFNLIEIEFKLDKKFYPLKVFKKKRYFSHRIIEEFMLITNCVITKYLEKNNANLIYRIHESPDKSSLVLLKNCLKKFGYENNKCSSPKDFQKILKIFRGDSKEEFFSMLLLRSMKKAIYAVHNLGHFGLSFKKYTHFTSPIRRYSDFIIHHVLKKVIINNSSLVFNKSRKKKFLLDVADHISFKEKQSIEAEREIIKRKSVWYMENKIGKNFNAIIKGFSDHGIYISLDSGIDGLIKKLDLPDKFIYDEKNYCYRSKNKYYEIGQNIRVKLISVDCEKFYINFIICK